MNNVSFIGRLTRDPDIRVSSSGTKVALFTLAVNRIYKSSDGTQADFFPIVCYGKQADFAEGYFFKGMQVGFTGRAQVRSWEKDGKTNTITEFIAEKLYFADAKREARVVKQETIEDFDFTKIDDEDLPF